MPMPVDLKTYSVEENLKKLTRAALTQTCGNRTEASILLGISLRTLRNWMRKWDLAKEFPLN